MFKYQVLNAFIEKYSDLPQQGTDAWKQLRTKFIGGSEIATVIKQNKNKTVNKLIIEKLGFDTFAGNVVTHWGNVFEEIIRQHCEEVFTCTIKETGSIPYKHGILSYSPDGLAVVPTISLTNKFGKVQNIDNKSPTQLVLFEFKCPHSRIATSVVPEYYLPQVSIGMNIIDIMQTAVFAQATFRRCSFKDLLYNTKHNGYGHYKRADVSSNPVECGFMLIYMETADDYMHSLLESIEDSCEVDTVNGIIDIGNLYDNQFLEEILGNCVNHTFKVDYSTRMMYNQSVFAKDDYTIDLYNESLQFRMMQVLNKKMKHIKNIVAIMPFKLLNIHFTSIAKNPNYITEQDAFNRAEKVLQCIDDHKGMDNKSDVQKSIRKYKL